MAQPLDLWEEIVRMRRAGEPAALCTVLLTRGSTPGKDSMKMLVRGDGSAIGSVGGGCVEADVMQMAQEVIASDRAATRSFTLNQSDDPENGLICGGQITILVEAVVPPVLVLLGGGHVGGAAARVGKEAGLRVEICDPREEYAHPAQHPAADACFAGEWEDAIARIAPAQHHYLVSLPRSHGDDLRILRAIHRSGCRPKYLGLIGSRAKKAQLDRVLADEGIPAAWLASVKTPIGLDIGAKSAGEIAVSLIAELVRLRRTGALTAATPQALRKRATPSL